MGVRGELGGVRPRRRLLNGLVAASVIGATLCIASISIAMPAGRALDHHATVVNGEIVGSAFPLREGLAATNAHVVAGRRPGGRIELVSSRAPRRQVQATILAVSSRMDLALLIVPPGFLPDVPNEVSSPRTGQPVVAAGVDASGKARGLPVMELHGRIVHEQLWLREFGPGMVAGMPGVRPGFSGGPLFDTEGRLVGMIAAIRPGSPLREPRARAASGFAPKTAEPPEAEEAFVIDATALLAEAERLLRGIRR